MGVRGHHTYFHGFFVAGFSGVETTFAGAAVMPLDCVADVVAEHCYALLFYTFPFFLSVQVKNNDAVPISAQHHASGTIFFYFLEIIAAAPPPFARFRLSDEVCLT